MNGSLCGKYDQKKKKEGKWTSTLNKNFNGYYKKGEKQGIWKELFQNYLDDQKQAEVFETGEYYNDLRMGKWNYIFQDMKIGGGFYNKDGDKQGKWIDIDEEFDFCKQVTFHGEYNKNGMKVGKWDIMYCMEDEDQQLKMGIYIGGGLYDQEGNENKIGKWVDLDERFNNDKEVTYIGEYNIDGMKIGRWDICQVEGEQMGDINIMGVDHMIKKEIRKRLESGQNWIKIFILINKSLILVGRWDIMYREFYDEEYEQIGGGSYDQEGNQKKIGNWVELDKKFYIDKQVTYVGEYNINGMKVGRWDICFVEGEQIGGGQYDKKGNEKKIGKWVELDKWFYDHKQLTYAGEYNMNGMKVGRWDAMYCSIGEKEYKQMQQLQYKGEQKLYLVQADLMMGMEIRQNLDGGQNQVSGSLMVMSFSKVNIIGMVKKLVNGSNKIFLY